MPRGKAALGKRQRKDGYGVAPPLPVNEVLVDAAGGRWSLGRLFATGGFGSLYFVQRSKECSETPAVAKLELSSNGPLFQEIHLYQRVGQKRRIDEWRESHGLTFFGMPYLLASGIHHSFGREYRFLIIPRYGISVESLRSSAGGTFQPFAVFKLAISCLNVLQYLHCSRYVYADLKGDNVLVENLNVTKYAAEVEIWKSYVIDFGLAYVVSPKATYKPESKNAHNGTRDFTSIDAHCGASPSFRGDVEILGYNFLLWLCGYLPWSDCSTADAVFEMKKVLKANLRQELKKMLVGKLSFAVRPAQSFFEHAYALGYTDPVDFDHLRSVLEPFTVVKEIERSMRDVSSRSDKATVISSPVPKKAKANVGRRLGVHKKNTHVEFAECSPKTSDRALNEKRVANQTSKQVVEAAKATPGSCSARIVPGLRNFPSTTRSSILRRMSIMVRKKYTHLTEPRHSSSNGVAHPTNESGQSTAQLHDRKIDSTSSSRKYAITPSGRQLRPR
ncbi:nucleosomal histone kinase 1 [Trichuris trichiura]|uniref:non-specific serine/threonine protein kinase n=1 Tax=Trichuris trichiura TaxID=36087 RepID=A0A077Z941_TRITR|nr:nucleosomal histone kinase 1 [Trichuris trichiura]